MKRYVHAGVRLARGSRGSRRGRPVLGEGGELVLSGFSFLLLRCVHIARAKLFIVIILIMLSLLNPIFDRRSCGERGSGRGSRGVSGARWGIECSSPRGWTGEMPTGGSGGRARRAKIG
jgi:hypothetical protein